MNDNTKVQHPPHFDITPPALPRAASKISQAQHLSVKADRNPKVIWPCAQLLPHIDSLLFLPLHGSTGFHWIKSEVLANENESHICMSLAQHTVSGGRTCEHGSAVIAQRLTGGLT